LINSSENVVHGRARLHNHHKQILAVIMPKQVIVQSSIEAIEIIDTPIPTPRDKEIVIKVAVSGTNVSGSCLGQ